MAKNATILKTGTTAGAKADTAVDVQRTVGITTAEIEKAAEVAAGRISKETAETMEQFSIDKADAAAAPIVVMLGLASDFTEEQLLALPEPGSTVKDVGNNRIPDKFTITGSDGKKRPASFYTLMFQDTAKGHSIAAQRAAIAAISNGKAMPEGFNSKLWNSYAAMDNDDWTREDERLKVAATNQRGVMVKGVRLAIGLLRVNKLEHVSAEIIMKDDAPMRTPRPIVLKDKPWDPAKGSKSTLVSIDTFLAFDVDKAIAAGGKREHLVKTAERGTPATGKAKDKNAVPMIENKKQLDGFISSLAHYLSKDSGKAEMLELATDDAVTISLCVIADKIDSVTSKKRHVYEAWLEANAVKGKVAA